MSGEGGSDAEDEVEQRDGMEDEEAIENLPLEKSNETALVETGPEELEDEDEEDEEDEDEDEENGGWFLALAMNSDLKGAVFQRLQKT